VAYQEIEGDENQKEKGATNTGKTGTCGSQNGESGVVAAAEKKKRGM